MRLQCSGHIYADSAPRIATPEVYERYGERESGYTKIVLKSDQAA